jgi:hypothetical protein
MDTEYRAAGIRRGWIASHGADSISLEGLKK